MIRTRNTTAASARLDVIHGRPVLGRPTAWLIGLGILACTTLGCGEGSENDTSGLDFGTLPPVDSGPDTSQSVGDAAPLPPDSTTPGPDASVCEPTDETCDGLDNDCDDSVDEETVVPSENQNGVCAGAVQICNGADGLEEPNYEDIVGYADEDDACDDRDNDCDGFVDEDFDLPNNLAHCGVCGKACEAPANGSVECIQGECVKTCDPRYVGPGPDCILEISKPLLVAPSEAHHFTSRDDADYLDRINYTRRDDELMPPVPQPPPEDEGADGAHAGQPERIEDRFVTEVLPEVVDLERYPPGRPASADRYSVRTPFCTRAENHVSGVTMTLIGHSLGFHRPLRIEDSEELHDYAVGACESHDECEHGDCENNRCALPSDGIGADFAVQDENGKHEFYTLYTSGKASFRVNGNPDDDEGFINLSNSAHEAGEIRIQPQAMAYGGIGGGFHTLKVSIDMSDLTLFGGDRRCENVIEFRFNGTDGVTSSYRILDFDFVDARADSQTPCVTQANCASGEHCVRLGPALDTMCYGGLLPDEMLVDDPPESWGLQDGEALNTQTFRLGRAIFYRRDLLRDSPLRPKFIHAACGDCHAHDGRDLQYYAYSDKAIESRALFHGLTQSQSEAVAYYIRALGHPDYGNVAPHGRPWRAPFQPGQGIDDDDDDRDRGGLWAAGVSLAGVLDGEADQAFLMAKALFDVPRDGENPPAQPGADEVAEWLAGYNVARAEERFAVAAADGQLSMDVAQNLEHARVDGLDPDEFETLAILAGYEPTDRDPWSTINLRTLPVAIQLPDWNHWLPVVHPLDAFAQPRDYDANRGLQGVRLPFFNEDEMVQELAKDSDLEFIGRSGFNRMSRAERRAYIAGEGWCDDDDGCPDLDYPYRYLEHAADWNATCEAEADCRNACDDNDEACLDTCVDEELQPECPQGCPLDECGASRLKFFVDSPVYSALWESHDLLAAALAGPALGPDEMQELLALTTGEVIWTEARDYLAKDGVRSGSEPRVHFSPAVALAEANGVPKEMAKRSLVTWLMVKHWELIREHGLEEKAFRFTDHGEPLQWPVGKAQTGHMPAPHVVASNEHHFQSAGAYDQDPIVGLYESNAWYHLQMVLNSGARSLGTGKPVDWIYYYSHTRRLSTDIVALPTCEAGPAECPRGLSCEEGLCTLDDLNCGEGGACPESFVCDASGQCRHNFERFREPLRYLATIVKGLQMRHNGSGPTKSGWRLRYVMPWRFLTSAAGESASQFTLSINSPQESRTKNLIALLGTVVPEGWAQTTELRTHIAEAMVKVFTYKAQLFSAYTELDQVDRGYDEETVERIAHYRWRFTENGDRTNLAPSGDQDHDGLLNFEDGCPFTRSVSSLVCHGMKIDRGHGANHVFQIPSEDILAPPANVTYSLEPSMGGGHTHEVELTDQDFVGLRTGQFVKVKTIAAQGPHTHTIEISCDRAPACDCENKHWWCLPPVPGSLAEDGEGMFGKDSGFNHNDYFVRMGPLLGDLDVAEEVQNNFRAWREHTWPLCGNGQIDQEEDEVCDYGPAGRSGCGRCTDDCTVEYVPTSLQLTFNGLVPALDTRRFEIRLEGFEPQFFEFSIQEDGADVANGLITGDSRNAISEAIETVIEARLPLAVRVEYQGRSLRVWLSSFQHDEITVQSADNWLEVSELSQGDGGDACETGEPCDDDVDCASARCPSGTCEARE